ncbi:GDSL-type esterase/lipase family protein [Bacillus testis]|uniref:GDSL-type esterase/lipase family protein n=1 Tax=Bacillus testis TaxID=1622072 RepID=UPI00067E8A77|nr:GDSL-type esterase/lipase family protein [Bacillus testis]
MRYKKGLWLSLAVNIILLSTAIFIFFRIGGISYVKDHLTAQKEYPPHVKIRTDALTLVGKQQKDIVFFGDSHTNYFEWGEYMDSNKVANRGVASDTTGNMLKRVHTVNQLKPKKVFIMAGINDIQLDVPVGDIFRHYQEIVKRIRKANPNVHIYIQSTLPVNQAKYKAHFYHGSYKLNKAVRLLNNQLKTMTGSQVTFIDLYADLAKKGQLPQKWTVDGLHLNKEGYEIWLDHLKPYL